MHKVLIQVERLRACRLQLNAIIVEYYEKTVASEGVPPVDMAWELFSELEDKEGFILITARDTLTGIIVGFVTYYVGPHPHHKTVVFATCGTLAVKLSERGKGIAHQLLDAAEPLLRMHHVKYISHGYRSVYNADPIFTKHGYKLAELQFVKEL
jgi:GNAT superfamily N-acetyltransferase